MIHSMLFGILEENSKLCQVLGETTTVQETLQVLETLTRRLVKSI